MSTQPPAWARSLRWLTESLTLGFPGGPRLLKLAWVINFQKGGTFVFVGLLMWWYGNTSTLAWVYLALHGSYGLCWLLKDAAFPDASWQRRVTVGGGLMAFALVLGPYWLIAWLLISDAVGTAYLPISGLYLAFCIALHTLGVAIMLAADAQKYFTLRERHGLIEDGMFRHIRHPNYLGEMMIYATYALLVRHWLPWLILAAIWSGLFAVNIACKEASLARHPGWAAYAARTGLLLPKLRPARKQD